MPWNPQKYNEFKNIRYQPFFDLMELISPIEMINAVDIGCGTGEQTSLLSKKFKNTAFLGIDSSSEMLYESSAFVKDKLRFQHETIEAFVAGNSKWDLIFSNAALQWVDDHKTLFPRLISKLNGGGQLAVQMPVQNENLLNKILYGLVQEKPFVDFLGKWKRKSPVLQIDDYAKIMFEGGLSEIQVIQKVYPIIVDEPQELFDFISGSALIPYLELMSENEKETFIAVFKERIAKEFQKFPTIYAFKRILLYGKMSIG